ncbi:drug/metabolite transporter permease [Bifidobacterium sp. SO1]|uniref:drug/metabolite transporter permease n=1 Tax=Bifidobacterium sp. SO1 TaxID=2809029 RepID=UPI001BDCAB16|nr:drug/metabolite transporter permease [Bifidobacterium sp. SO1]MBT1161923.1 drug/metabolite DMT transporter permease [Bifidobacterium sp. SO1]
MMTGLVRVVADAFGATLGSALIYTTGVVLLMIFHRPAPLREYPRKYLLFGGLLFVFYESSISLSIGLASTAESSVEVSLVNYLWPTMMVLLTAAVFPTVRRRGVAADRRNIAAAANDGTADGVGGRSDGNTRPSRLRSVLRVLPGAIVATAGVVLAVGGNSGLDWGLAAQHIAANPLPYLLAFAGASAWSVYAVFTPAMADGKDGTSVFFPFVAVALWVIHFTSGEGWPPAAPSIWGWLAVLGAAASIAGGYACWGHGILHGSMRTLAMASYAAPVLSTAASAVLLGLALSLPFWCGALLVAAGSILNWWISSRRR